MDYKKTNREAIDKAENTYGKMRDVEGKHSPNEVINYLRTILGLCCSRCGNKGITWPTFKFYNYEPNVICYGCQEKEKNGIK